MPEEQTLAMVTQQHNQNKKNNPKGKVKVWPVMTNQGTKTGKLLHSPTRLESWASPKMEW